MKSRDGRSAVLCVALAGVTACAFGQSPSDADKKFLRSALEGGNAEVQLGQLAEQKSNSEDIKHFGQKMIDDHTKLANKMRQVADNVGITPPAGTQMGDKARTSELEVLSGDSFDKAYIKAMVKDHRQDLQEFRKEANTGVDPSIREAAKDGAQVVEAHLKMAEEIARNHNIDIK